MSIPSVKDAVLTPSQESLLHSLERRVQVQQQSERNASLLTTSTVAPTVKAFLKQHVAQSKRSHDTKQAIHVFSSQVDQCVKDWHRVYTHAHDSFALVEEMESSHMEVVAKTQSLYDSFEMILQQVDALRARVQLIATPMPHFIMIDSVAQTLGFGVKFASPSSMASSDVMTPVQPPVQVFQHKRTIDPTTKSFQDALEKIDGAVTFLQAHQEYKDAVCYIEAYQTLTAGALQCLKEYAMNGLETAREAVLEAIAKHDSSVSTDWINEASPYYVHFTLVAPSLTAVAQQLQRLATSLAAASNETIYMSNVLALADVCTAYAQQRVQLLTPIVSMYCESLQDMDLVNMIRLSGIYLIRVCEIEFRLFHKLFGRDPTDLLFKFKTREEEEEEEETAFERLMYQLSAIQYNIFRPLLLSVKDVELLCELIHILQSEIIESMITPRDGVVGTIEPVFDRMIQDTQERLILCVQKYIRDEIQGFLPTPEDLDYPAKLSQDTSLYATWYPALEHTLLCLSKIYHVVNMEIFEELAQDAIQICTVSLRMAAADITVAKGSLHGSLFLVKHLLTLREQITPFEINFSMRAKGLDFTSTTDAMTHLLSDVGLLFRSNGFVAGLLPQIYETTWDVKKEVEMELKKSCTTFIEAVLQLVAQPLLTSLKTPLHDTSHQFIDKTIIVPLQQQWKQEIPRIQELIHLYLKNPSTEMILFKPIQRNLLEAIEHLAQQTDDSMFQTIREIIKESSI